MKRIFIIFSLFILTLNIFSQYGDEIDRDLVNAKQELIVRDTSIVNLIIEHAPSGTARDAGSGISLDGNNIDLRGTLNKDAVILGAGNELDIGTSASRVSDFKAFSGYIELNSTGDILFQSNGQEWLLRGDYWISLNGDTLANLDDVRELIDESQLELPFNLSYTFSSTITDSRPGVGFFRLNNATLANVTEIYTDYFDVNSVSKDDFLAMLDTGTVVSVLTDENNYALYKATGGYIDNGNYFTYKVTYQSHNGVISGLSTIDLDISNSTGGGGGVADSVFSEVTAYTQLNTPLISSTGLDIETNGGDLGGALNGGDFNLLEALYILLESNLKTEIQAGDTIHLNVNGGGIIVEQNKITSESGLSITTANNVLALTSPNGTIIAQSKSENFEFDGDTLRGDGSGNSDPNAIKIKYIESESVKIGDGEVMTGTTTSKFAMENTLTDSLTTVKLKADTVMEYITKSTVSGDEGIAIVGGQLSVGSHDEPHEFVAGGGDSYVDGLVVFQTPDDIVYTDQTSKAIVLNDPYPSFGGTAIGQTVYFGSDTTWLGFKINTSTLVNPGTGDVIREYYDGDSWEQFTVMATDANSLESRANSVGSVIGSEQVRLGGLVDAAKVSINGSIKYYIRFRISSAITSDGTTDQVKIHSDRFEVNATGQTENFGQAIYKRPLGVHLTTTAEIDGLAPKDGTIDYTTTYSLKQKKNRLEDGVLDGSGGIITIPDGLDTSKDLEFYINYKVDAASSGNIEFELEATQFEVGDLVDGTTTPGQQLSNIQTIAINEENTIKQLVFKLDIEELLPGEFVEYVYFRDASAGNTNDTYPDDLSIISFNVVGFFWKP